jgi:hypothetical protein
VKERIGKFWQLLNADWVSAFMKFWKGIPSTYIWSFVIVFIGINIAFAFHTFSFI